MALLIDLRHACRRLLLAPSFTIVAVLTLGLGIGSTTAIYSIVDALMLRPLPYAEPARLVDLGVASERGAMPYFDANQLATLKQRTDIFSSIDGWTYASGTLLGGDEPVLAAGAALGGGVMHTLGVTPQRGRYLDESDIRADNQVIVLSDGAWRQRFGADPEIIGRKIRVDNRAVEVVGVMPASFTFPGGRREFWIPLTATVGGRPPALQIVGRIRSDLSLDEARARIEASAIDEPAQAGATAPRGLRVMPALSRQLNPPVRMAIYLLAGAVGFVLLIACANIANLLLVQYAGRSRETAVRTALGATRVRLVRQFLTEAVVLAGVGGLFGVLVAEWAIAMLQAAAPEEMTFFGVHEISLDPRVLLFAALVTVVTGCLCGLLPAIRGSQAEPHDALKAGSRGATSAPGQERLRRGFVVLQLAVSVVLLIGATLLARSFVRLTQVDPGFDPQHLATITLELPRWKYPNATAREEFFDTLSTRLRGLPDVVGVARGVGAPPDGGNLSFGLTFEVEARGIVLDDPRLVVPNSSVDADYFSVMGIPMVAGRAFSKDDVRGAPPVMVINQAMASRLWPGGNPVGQRLRMRGGKDPWYTVVGIVGDVYQFDYAQTRGQFAYYVPISQTGTGSVQTLAIRTGGDPKQILPLVREQVRAQDPEQYIWKLDTVRTKYAAFLALPRFYTSLMAALAGLGIAIAAIGLYGMLAYTISQRTREFGVRLALGAQKADILRMVLSGGIVLTCVGLAVGGAASLFATRFLETLLVDVPRLDPVAYLATGVLLASVALLACWLPARRATEVDPVVALRAD